jgi:hypothetical protein
LPSTRTLFQVKFVSATVASCHPVAQQSIRQCSRSRTAPVGVCRIDSADQ